MFFNSKVEPQRNYNIKVGTSNRLVTVAIFCVAVVVIVVSFGTIVADGGIVVFSSIHSQARRQPLQQAPVSSCVGDVLRIMGQMVSSLSYSPRPCCLMINCVSSQMNATLQVQWRAKATGSRLAQDNACVSQRRQGHTSHSSHRTSPASNHMLRQVALMHHGCVLRCEEIPPAPSASLHPPLLVQVVRYARGPPLRNRFLLLIAKRAISLGT